MGKSLVSCFFETQCKTHQRWGGGEILLYCVIIGEEVLESVFDNGFC